MGIVLWAMSIPGYCYVLDVDRAPQSSIPTDTNYTCTVVPSFSSLDITCYVQYSQNVRFDVSYSVVTSQGTFVLRNQTINLSVSTSNTSYSLSVSGLSSSRSWVLPGYYINSFFEVTPYFSYEYDHLSPTTGSNLSGASSLGELRSVSTSGNLSYTNVQSSSGSDYMQILTNIYNELLAQGLTLDDLYTELLDQGLSLDSLVSDLSLLKKSLCYDFADTIDGNYHLSSLYYSYLTYSFNHDVLPIGYAAFDFFANSSTNLRFTFRVPESCNILVLSSAIDSNFNIPTVVGIYDYDGNPITYSQEPRYGRNVVIGRYITIPDAYKYSFLSIEFSFLGSARARFALYDYVVGANDILNYMVSQWGDTQAGTDSLVDNISDTGDMQSDVNVIEDMAFTDFTGAYDHTGIAAFSWTVFSGMSVFSSIVNKFYFALPSEFSLYITAVLIVGVIAVLISAVGRIIKKGGD